MRRRINRFVSDMKIRIATRELDPLFYVAQYEDLRIFESERLLREHYFRHGRSEGRFPNNASYRLHLDKAGHPEAPVRADSWHSALVVAQLMAWCGDRLIPPPSNRKQAIELFERRGFDELWPLRFNYLFDWRFYVRTYKIPAQFRRSASDAYRHFLTAGLTKGLAPNETVLLYQYLGGSPYPECFDWQAYAARAAPLGRRGRVSSLKHLFEAGHRDFAPYIKFLGRDAPWLLTAVGRHALVRGKAEEAAAAFEAASTVTDAGIVASLLADSYLKLGRMDDALQTYERSVASGTAPLSAYFRSIDIFCQRDDFSSAFEILGKAFKPWRHKAEFRDKLERCVELYFQRRSAEAHKLYRDGLFSQSSHLREQADRLLAATLDRIAELYTRFDDVPAASPEQSDGYVTILAYDGLRQCTHYRVEQKVELFGTAGIPVRVFSHDDVDGFMASLVGARAAIFYRVAAIPQVLRAILHANGMGLQTYYEIDDLIFDPACYPDPLESFEGQIGVDEYAGLQFAVPLLRYAMSKCKRGIASTKALAARMQTIPAEPSVLVLHNGLDSRNERWIEAGALPPANESGRIRLFYGSGTKAHNADFNDLIAPALLELMERHSEVDLVVAGHLKITSQLSAMADRVHVFPFTPDVDAYWSILASCDINLAVLRSGNVADCKSAIKWLEAAVLQIPSVVSETATYAETIAHGADGYIASSREDWVKYLGKLVTDGGTRRRIGANARRKALESYDVDTAAAALREEFDPVEKQAPRSLARKRLRVLICNVFFHPQSHGGATRVVEDNVRSFLRLYDDLDIAIFCSDEGASPAGRLRMGSFDGVPVYRLSTPIGARMDWQPFNPDNGMMFGSVLSHFKPDIIHFHCIQRLTASILEEALNREIPCLVTLHDGWWISDHQFLVDEDGFLRLPTTDIIGDCKDRPSPVESIERRRRLGSLLQQSKALLSVSSAFAAIYENAGHHGIRVVENGIPELQRAARKQRADGRLALGHIGGRSAHKGAFLIEAALRQEEYDNLHLTMVDGTLPPGQTVETTWGNTPVTLTGPYPQSGVGELYAQLDVLLAPSTWPESYGLVTREALWHGLWVVASDLGAVAQGITNGKNGYVIDTRTTASLKRILRELDEGFDGYRRSSTANRLAMRSTDEQARELHSLYWEMARITKGPENPEHRSRAA